MHIVLTIHQVESESLAEDHGFSIQKTGIPCTFSPEADSEHDFSGILGVLLGSIIYLKTDDPRPWARNPARNQDHQAVLQLKIQ